MVRGGGMERDAHTGGGAVRVRGGCWYYGRWHGEGCPRGIGPQHVHTHVHVHVHHVHMHMHMHWCVDGSVRVTLKRGGGVDS